MEKMTYKPAWLTPLLVLGLAGAGLLFSVLGNGHTRPTDLVPWLLAIAILAIVLDLKVGTHVYIKGGVICRVDHFVCKKCLKVQDIRGIHYTPTFIVGQANRSVYIFTNPHDRRAVIEMSNTAFSRETLARIIADLKKLNASITFDQNAEELLKQHV